MVIPGSYSNGAPGWTANEVVPMSHPTLPLFAVPIDPAVTSVDGRQTIVNGTSERVNLSAQQVLGSDWSAPLLSLSQAQAQQSVAKNNP